MLPLKRRRVLYSPPKALSQPRKFDFVRTSDEYCNPSVFIQVPRLGGVTVFWKLGSWRAEACNKCQAEDGPWCAACLSCHWYPACHPEIRQCLDYTGHLEPFAVCPDCGGQYCTECEDDPAYYCPKVEQ